MNITKLMQIHTVRMKHVSSQTIPDFHNKSNTTQCQDQGTLQTFTLNVSKLGAEFLMIINDNYTLHIYQALHVTGSEALLEEVKEGGRELQANKNPFSNLMFVHFTEKVFRL